jgi:hypothetical protein
MSTEKVNKNIYEIKTEYAELAAKLEDLGGVLEPEDERALAINQEELTAKACGYGFIILKFEDREAAIDKEIARLTALKKPVTNAIARMKASVQDAMELFGITKVEGDTIRLSFRKSTRLIKPETVDLKKIPAKFKTKEVVIKVDYKAITDALKAGEVIDGFELRDFNNLQIK